MRIIIFGASGFVGNAISETLKNSGLQIITPSSNKVDITNHDKVSEFVAKNKPKFLINLASYTNIKKAEEEKGNILGKCWLINVTGTLNLIDICQKNNIFLIQISTDGIFPGNKIAPGPYEETASSTGSRSNLTWYGYTKLKSERLLKSYKNSAIVRISYPFGSPDSDKDLTRKIVKYINLNYAFFKNQNLTPTFLPDLAKALIKIINLKKPGIYHVACANQATPYKLATFIAKEIGISKKTQSKILKKPKGDTMNSYPISIYGGLKTNITSKVLELRFHNWKTAVRKTLSI